MNILTPFNTSSEINSTNCSSGSDSDGYACQIDITQTTFYSLLLAANILHLTIIYRLKRQNKNVATQLLFLINIHDAGFSMLSIPKKQCLYVWLSCMRPCLFALAESLWEMTALMRYVLLAMACYDRYVAICQPFRYFSNLILINVMKSLIGIFLFVLALHSPLLSLQYCIESTYEEWLQKAKLVIQSLWLAMCLTLIMKTVFSVLREFYRMRQMSEGAAQSGAEDTTLLKTTYLVLATAAGFLCCLLPILGLEVYAAIKASSGKPRNLKLQMDFGMLFDSYSIINIVICAAMNVAFRREVKTMCSCCHHKAVIPQRPK